MKFTGGQVASSKGHGKTMAKKEFEREKLLTNQETEEDQILNISLRPSKLQDFIGQKTLVENLKVSLQAAMKRKEPIEQTANNGHRRCAWK